MKVRLILRPSSRPMIIIVILSLLICGQSIFAQQVDPPKQEYICRGRRYFDVTGNESGLYLKLKISFNDLRVTRQLNTRYVPFFGENANCITGDQELSSAESPAACKTLEGSGKFSQEVRCQNKELQLPEYGARIQRSTGDLDFVGGKLVCFISGIADSYTTWNLSGCHPIGH